MVDYGSLTLIERIVMGVIVIVTNAAALPIILHLFNKPHLRFEGIVSFMSAFTSFMYHLCEVTNRELYLSQLEWHRLDNVFVIAGICIFILHIMGNQQSRSLIYSTLIISILSQEKYPWEIRFTIAPIVLFCIIAPINRLINWGSVKVTYNWSNFIKSGLFLAIGGYFFMKGLDEYDDYLRFNHGMWHMLGGPAVYFGLQVCTTELVQKNKAFAL